MNSGDSAPTQVQEPGSDRQVNISLNRANTFGTTESKKRPVDMAAGRVRVQKRNDSDMGRQLPPTGSTTQVSKKPKSNPYSRPNHMNVTVHQKDAYQA